MVLVESSSMATKFVNDEDELELCLSLGGPFKKEDKADQPIEFRRVKDLGVDLHVKHEINGARRKETRKNREARQQKRSGGERECKRIKAECKEVTNGVGGFGLSFSELGNGYGYGSGQYKEYSKVVTVGSRSPISSSSDVSDPSSSSRQEGGNCEFGDQTKPVKSPVNNVLTGTEVTARSTDGPNDMVEVKTQERSNSLAKETGKPPKPRPNGNEVNGSLLPFARMPCVTSTGNGPEGKTVNGFLYRYSKSEISIICVCHGKSFSPAEFIIHAGGSNVSHPLRHITVVSSTL